MSCTSLLSLVTLATCPWLAPPTPPSVLVRPAMDQHQTYQAQIAASQWYDQRFATCALAGTGQHRIEFVSEGRVLLSDELKLQPALAPKWASLWNAAMAGQLCRAATPNDTKQPGPERLTVSVRVVADGDFAPLAFASAPMTIACPSKRCSGRSVDVRADMERKQVRLTWKITRDSLACAGASTLVTMERPAPIRE